MHCPICLDDIRQAVMAPCFHAYCRPCIEAWNSNCPICRGITTPLIESPWLNTRSSSSSSDEENLECLEDQEDEEYLENLEYLEDEEELSRTNLHLQTLVGMLKQWVPKTVPNKAEYNQLTFLTVLNNGRDDKLAKIHAEYEQKLQAAYDQYDRDLQASYRNYERELNREAVETKQIEADNEYVQYLIDIGTSLSTQQPEVLVKHFLPYVTKLQPYIPNSFMGLLDGIKVEFDMPETPICYVAERNELLVSNGQRLYYYQKPNVSISHSGVVSKFRWNLCIMEPTELRVYDYNLSFFRSERPKSGHYFAVVCDGDALQVPIDGALRWGGHTVDLRRGYDKIWAEDGSLVVYRDNTMYLYTKNGVMKIHRPDGSIETHQNGLITVTKDGQTLVNSYEYQPIEETKQIRQGVIVTNSGKISFIADNYSIVGPKIGETYTYIDFTDCQNGRRTLCMRSIK